VAPDVEILPKFRNNKDKKDFHLHLNFRKCLFSEAKYNKLISYLRIPSIRNRLIDPLKCYFANILILKHKERQWIYPHIQHHEKSIRLPVSDDVTFLILNHLAANKQVKSIRERLILLIEETNKRNKHIIQIPPEFSNEKLRKEVQSKTLEIILKMIEEIEKGMTIKKNNKGVLREKIGMFPLPDPLEKLFKEKMKESGIRLEEDKKELYNIKKCLIQDLLTFLFDFEMIQLLPRKPTENFRFTEIAKTDFEKRNHCILIEEGEASFAILLENLQSLILKGKKGKELKKELKTVLCEQHILKRNGKGIYKKTERYKRMVRWIKKLFSEEKYKTLLEEENSPWKVFAEFNFNQTNIMKSDHLINDFYNILRKHSNKNIHFFRVSDSIWQEEFRSIVAAPISIIFFPVIEENLTCLSGYFIGQFDIEQELSQNSFSEIEQVIILSKLLYSTIGEVAIFEELRRTIDLESRKTESEKMLRIAAHTTRSLREILKYNLKGEDKLLFEELDNILELAFMRAFNVAELREDYKRKYNSYMTICKNKSPEEWRRLTEETIKMSLERINVGALLKNLIQRTKLADIIKIQKRSGDETEIITFKGALQAILFELVINVKELWRFAARRRHGRPNKTEPEFIFNIRKSGEELIFSLSSKPFPRLPSNYLESWKIEGEVLSPSEKAGREKLGVQLIGCIAQKFEWTATYRYEPFDEKVILEFRIPEEKELGKIVALEAG